MGFMPSFTNEFFSRKSMRWFLTIESCIQAEIKGHFEVVRYFSVVNCLRSRLHYISIVMPETLQIQKTFSFPVFYTLAYTLIYTQTC